MPRKSQYQRTDGYTGGQVWRVEYPGRNPLDILAPTWQEAAVTAAAAWGIRWQSAEYHQEVKCTPMGHRSQVAGGVVHG